MQNIHADSDQCNTNKGGAWRLVCEDIKYLKGSDSDSSDSDSSDLEDNEAQIDKIWNSLCTIHKDAPELFSKPPLKKPVLQRTHAYIFCFTPDRTNESRIRLAAEFIRSRVLFLWHMYYLEDNSESSAKRNILFQHTPEGELYKYIDGHQCKIIANPSAKSCSDENEHRLPSEVYDMDYLYMPSTEEGILNMKRQKGGKWMVFTPDNNLARHDATWLALLSLYRKGVLVGLKASTKVINPANKNEIPTFTRTNPVIHCYTADADDRYDVLRAIVAIRSVVDNDYMLFYKSNSASINGEYYHEGKKSVTKYQHTVEGGLYERDHRNRYKLIVPGKVKGNGI